jgi:hypothetical protein
MCSIAVGETYGYKLQTWENAKCEAIRAIVRIGKAGSTISYSDLSREITSIAFHPHDHIFHLMLGQISCEEEAAGRGMLSALVVLKDSGMPGEGFWDWQKDLAEMLMTEWLVGFGRPGSSSGAVRTIHPPIKPQGVG